jgi:hypothetical protein
MTLRFVNQQTVLSGVVSVLLTFPSFPLPLTRESFRSDAAYTGHFVAHKYMGEHRGMCSYFFLTSVLTRPVSRLISGVFTYEKRRGRESNPRIAVLQTATLPLGYPAVSAKTQTIWHGAPVSM